VRLKLKAARAADSGAWKKDATFTVAGLKAPPAEVAEAGLRCLWDDEIEVPANRTGLQHGVIYVRNLEITPRVDDSGEAQDTVPDAQQACPGDLEEAEVSGNQLRWLCGDITWEREEADSGKITASNVFVILRNNQGAEAICWSKFEEQTPADHAGTPFVFDLINGGQPCREDLNNPKQDLWNLMNWITFRPAQYEGVQPLVKFCQHESGQASFGESSAIPVTDEDSWAQNKTLGWNLYLMNPSSQVEPPKITVKLKGDANLEVALKELPNPALGDTPLVPPGSGTCPVAAPG